MVQWLRLHALKAGGPVSIPGQTRSHVPQLDILHAIAKIKDPVCRNEHPEQPNELKIYIFIKTDHISLALSWLCQLFWRMTESEGVVICSQLIIHESGLRMPRLAAGVWSEGSLLESWTFNLWSLILTLDSWSQKSLQFPYLRNLKLKKFPRGIQYSHILHV